MFNWQSKEGSSGCSKHFHNNDFNESKQSLETIRNETVFLIEKDWDDLDAPAFLKVCRVCLAMDVKMYHMTNHNLQQMYEQTTGILLGDDKLPQMFCWECAQRLINGSKFRTKALKTQMLLTEMLNNDKCITIRSIQSINRTENDLKSSLIKTSYDVNNLDDMKSELGDSRDAFDENIVSQESEETAEKGLQDIEIKDEPIYDAYGTDVDLKLSDTAIEPTGREKSVLVKIERVDDHELIMDKYKTSNVKFLPSEGSLDELTITRLTYGKPIVVIERLPDLASYINTVRRHEIKKANLCGDYEPDEPTSDKHVGAPAIRRKIDSTPQKEEQMKVNETMKRSKPSNNDIDTSLPNNISNISKDRPTFSNSSSQNSSSILNLGIFKNILNMSEGEPNVNSVVTYNKVFLTNNMKIAPKVCNSNTENDIRKQFPSKCVDLIASCSLLDSKNENNKPNIVNNSQKLIERKHLCHICQSKFTTKSSLKVHITRKHTKDKRYICDICNYRCSQKFNLTIHIKRKHTKEKNNSCHICQHKFATKSDLGVHLRRHTGDKPYKCDICDYRFLKKGDLNVHIRKHTGDKPYKCDICDYRSSQRITLNIHVRKHTGDKPYKCDICDFRCSQRITLNIHVRKHTGDKPYKCDICDFRCSRKDSLSTHLCKHTGDKPYKCDICDFRSSQKYTLAVHLRKHTRDKPYKCDICDYRSSQKGVLNVHLRKHTGDKPYKCDICDYRCSTKGNLIIHLRKHTGDKPYKCDICDFRCSRKDSLNIHVRKHTGDKPYVCHICHFRFSQKGSLLKHLNKH